jgi:multidrug efflux pump subunit AcrB
MKEKKRNIVEWAMHYRQIIILLTCCFMAFGIYGLADMKKNEFPDFTIRQGIVVAVCPGYTANEVERQVTEPLEDYIFSYKEVRKAKTISTSRDGMAVIQVQLNDNIKDKDEFWSKFKHGANDFKAQLPSSVVALSVMDDFGDTSALLITMESDDKTYRELDEYVDDLKDRLRRIEPVGRMTVYGMHNEQISVTLDNDRLSHYGLSDQTIAMTLFSKGFATTAGRVKSDTYVSPIYVGRTMNSLRDVQEMIVFSTPDGEAVRLKDVADVTREYPVEESVITNNGRKCLLLSVEMKKGKNIVQMGEAVKEVLDDYAKTLPQDVTLFKITDQSDVVAKSVSSFLEELLIAVCAVVIVVMLLLPMRVALVAASTIPISIFIALALFYAVGIELNTVTLAALIVTLGMIVDNSIVIIDSYLEMIKEGMSRWHASIKSATHFFKSIFSATLAISITFFPFLFTMSGMTGDFVESFPWAVTIILMISLLVAELLVPFMQFYFIRKPMEDKVGKDGKKRVSFLDLLQGGYDWLIDRCFAYPKTTIAMGAVSVVLGLWLLSLLPQKLLPTAERNQFAVEIYMPTGTAVEKTTIVADSLEHILRADSRVVSVASFKGCSSPRFQNTYAPQMGGSNFAQFIVNTTGNEATEEILDEYAPRYRDAFPEAVIRFKQLCYSEATYPIELRLSGDDLGTLKAEAERIEVMMRQMPELNLVRSNFEEPLAATKITLNEDESTRLGITNAQLETTLAMRYSTGIPVGTIWEDDYDVNVVLKSTRADSSNTDDLGNELVPVAAGLDNVPLRQIADVKPLWLNGQIVHRNGVRTITIMAEMERGVNAIATTSKIQEMLKESPVAEGITLTYGGELEENEEQMPNIVTALIIAVIIIFFILVWHFKRISTATLLLVSLTLCLFGTAVGVKIQGVDFSLTCTMGIISLMGILVRNGIIMVDYAEELRKEEKMCVRDAIYHSAKRRMRPIFLTSAAASMGVIPMIIGGSGLWMPMGTVIFYGTLITMFFILTIIPVAYWKVMAGSTKKRAMKERMERE